MPNAFHAADTPMYIAVMVLESPNVESATRDLTGSEPVDAAEVRVFRNDAAGTTRWAEDDRGFVGGADRLLDLTEAIQCWAAAEGLPDVTVRVEASAAQLFAELRAAPVRQ